MSDQLQTLLNEIKFCKERINMSPDDYPIRLKSAYTIAAREARDRIAKLLEEYTMAVQRNSITVAVVGSTEYTAKFEELARNVGVSLVADVSAFYKKIAEKIEPSIGQGREWTPNQHSLAIQYALHEGIDLGMKEAEYDGTVAFRNSIVRNFADTVEATRDTVRSGLKDVLVNLFVRKMLRDQAVDNNLAPESEIGVLLTGLRTQDEAQALLQSWPSRASSVVALTDVPTENQVKDAFEATLESTNSSNSQEAVRATTKKRK